MEKIQKLARTGRGARGAAAMKVVSEAKDLHETFTDGKGGTNLAATADRMSYAESAGATGIRENAEKFDEALKDRKANETKAPHTVKVKKNMLSRAIDALTQPPVNLPYPIAIKTVYEQETLKGTTTLVAYRLILDAMMSIKSEENQAREILESLKIKEE